MKYTATVCAPYRQFSGPLFGSNHSQMVRRVRVGAHDFRWGQLEYLEHWLAVFREYVLRGVCTASILSVSQCSAYFTLSAKKHLFCGNVFCMCWILLSRSQSIMSQPRPRATFCTYVYAASIGLIAASHLFRIKTHLPVYPLLYYCSSDDPTLLPQTAVHSLSSKICVCVLHVINDGWAQLLCSSKQTGVQVLQTTAIISCATPLGTSRRETLYIYLLRDILYLRCSRLQSCHAAEGACLFYISRSGKARDPRCTTAPMPRGRQRHSRHPWCRSRQFGCSLRLNAANPPELAPLECPEVLDVTRLC